MTFHGFCARVLRAHAVAAGLDPAFAVLDEPGARALRREAFDAALAGFLADRADGTSRADALDLAAAYAPDRLRRDDRRRARRAAQPRADTAGAAADRRGRPLGRAHASSTPPRRAPPSRCAARAASDDRARPRRDRRLPRDARHAAGRGAGHGRRAEGGRFGAGNGRASCRSAPRRATSTRSPRSPPRAATPARARCSRCSTSCSARFADAYAAAKRERSARRLRRPRAAHARPARRRARPRPRATPSASRGSWSTSSRTRTRSSSRSSASSTATTSSPSATSCSRSTASATPTSASSARGAPISPPRAATATLATSFRARPEILETIDAAFGDAHGDSWVALRPGRDDPADDEPRVELLLTDASAWAGASAPELVRRPPRGAGGPPRRGAARRPAHRELVRDGAAGRRRHRRAPARRDRHRPVRARDRAGGPRDARDRRAGLVGAPAGPGPLLLPRRAREPARRGGAARPARLAARRRVLGRARAAGDGRPRARAARSGTPSTTPRRACPAADHERLRAFRAWFGPERERAPGLGLDELLDRVVERTGYDLHVLALPGRRAADGERPQAPAARRRVRGPPRPRRARVHRPRRPPELEADAREPDAPVDLGDLEAVRLMTIHAAKGLEFPVVVVADLGRARQRRASRTCSSTATASACAS